MKLKLTLLRPGGGEADVVVTVEPTAPIASVAEALAERDPQGSVPVPSAVGLRLHGEDGRTTLPPAQATIAEVALRSGSRVSLAPLSELAQAGRGPAAATLRVLAGPDAGREFPLPAGSTTIGRSRVSDIRLDDPLVSKEHARLNVGDTVEIIDLRSANGILVGDRQVERAVLGRDDVAVLGDTPIAVTLHRAAADATSGSPTLDFNRSPRLVERYEGRTFAPPEAPTPPTPSRLPWLALIAPLIMGAAIYLVTRSVYSLLFIGLSPILGVGTYLEGRIGGKRAHRKARAAYLAELAALGDQIDAEHAREAEVRRGENPSVGEVVDACLRQTTLLWSRRNGMPEFLQVRLGVGEQDSRSGIETNRQRGVEADLMAELEALTERASRVDGVPAVGDLGAVGAVGVGGTGDLAAGVTRGLLVQLVGLHSPSDLVVVGVASPASSRRWEWLKWLPHTNSAYSPLPGGHLETSPVACAELVGALDDLVDSRIGDHAVPGEAATHPRIVVLVENDAPVLRARLVDLAERGGAAGVHVLWLAPAVDQLPAACRVFVDVPGAGPATAGLVDDGRLVTPLAVEPLSVEKAEQVARRLSPVVDVGALVDDDSDLPTSVTTLALVGPELGQSFDAVAERWRETDSLPIPPGEQPVKRRKAATLRALVGQGATSALHLDLRTQGPHALVGGTTGSGKSEFLQSWVLNLAATYSPARVTFLFVDYKGGAAFKDCTQLPHSVGMVTDLSPHLVRRALTSLRAELRHREELLQAHGFKDLAAMEKAGVAGCPPSLVIVVDEFAALVKEVPEFVDGVVDVAQRGRSLGLHLILATQQPSGVIKDNLRANTNLRVALRMADEADSTDVLGTPLAAGFDPELPGRAAAKTGPGRLTVFQSSFSGGHTPDVAPPPEVHVDELAFGPSRRWERPLADEGAEGPSDMSRMVQRILEANRDLAIPEPRRPWLPVLKDLYDFRDLPKAGLRADNRIVLGMADMPKEQAQRPVAFEPDRDGNMVVFGTGGSGKSALLRTVAVSAGLTLRGGPCHVYGLDFAGGALGMLEELPHVGSVILGDDGERVVRLLRQLEELIDDRATRWARVRAGDLDTFRTEANAPDEPRIILLVDGLAAFRQEYEHNARAKATWDRFTAIVSEGRQFGVHVVVSADRPLALSSAIASVIQRRVVLRMADENDYLTLGLPADVLAATSPPGRGMFDDFELQVAVLGGSASVVTQAQEIAKLGRTLRRTGTAEAPSVGRLPTRVPLSELPATMGDLAVVGVADDLQPLAIDPRGSFMVTGASGSGRTTALATFGAAVRRWRPDAQLLFVGDERSPLVSALPWAAVATETGDIAVLAKDVLARVERPGAPFFFLVAERPAELGGESADVVAKLISGLRVAGHGVVGDGDATPLGSYPNAAGQALRVDRKGFALQPEANDTNLFQAPFGSPQRADFPPGRGFFVLRGTVTKAQLAVPDQDGGQVDGEFSPST